MSPADGARPSPAQAYARWLDTLTRAGWSARPGDQAATGGRDAERIALGDALGRVTSSPVAARWPSPRANCAAMDGIAVRAADLSAPGAAGPEDRRANGPADEGANDPAIRLAGDQFQWIDTGDPMPPGADTVVMREWLLPRADGGVVVTGPADTTDVLVLPGKNVRAEGEDFAAGELLVPAGRRLRPGDLAAVAAGGHTTVSVRRRPVVAIVPTGDEIRPVGAVLARGDILDTNSLMLAARCRQLGAAPQVGAIVPDEPDALVAAVRQAAADADLVLVIAGSSRGRGDHAATVLAQVGGVAVAGVAVRPGHPALLGHAKRSPAADGPHGTGARQARDAGVAPVIGLPGYPLATAVIFELFAAPLLAALAGHLAGRLLTRARLDRDWSSRPDVDDWVLVTLTPGAPGEPPLATPARRGAGSISQLARADAWWPVPAGQGPFAAGAEIDVMPIPVTI
jgi:putative molybdopterin biosynthesis protein